jgi:hypothetical protein
MRTKARSWITSLSNGIVVAAAMLTACSGDGGSAGNTGGSSGGGGTDAGGAGGTSGAAGKVGVVECTDSKTIAGKPGFERCAEDIEHRVSAEQCNAPAPSQCQNKAGCASNADCTDKPNGYCAGTLPPGGNCSCIYGCSQDSDCTTDQLCQCDSPFNRCVRATCRTDADCGAGKVCAETLFDDCTRGYACQTDADECTRGSCGAPQPPSTDVPACVMGGGKRYCKDVNVCCVDPTACA